MNDNEQFELFKPDAIAARDKGMALVAANAGEDFAREARLFIIDYLRQNGSRTGEMIVNACKKAGIAPHDDRAFGPVFLALLKGGRICKNGSAPRIKGHYAPGATIWKLR